jgi:hypothetical protein
MKSPTRFCLVIAALIIPLCAASSHAQESDPPKFEIGAQHSSLSVNYPEVGGGTEYSVGFGGRFTFNLNRHVAFEAEGNFFPNTIVETVSAGGRAFQAQFGVKVGKRFRRFGLFAKARPGFVSFGETEKLTRSSFTVGGVPVPAIDFGIERKTHLSLDVGGVLEFYPSRHVVTRFDIGDTIIRYRERNDLGTTDVLVPPGIFVLPIVKDPAVTKHNFQFTAGVGYRFGGADKGGTPAQHSSSGGAGVPRFEVGMQFTSLVFNPPPPVFSFPVITSGENPVNPEAGFGGRATYNFNSHVAAEAEGNFFPRHSFPNGSSGGYPAQVQFGAKVGKRWRKVGVFAKARPGFVSFSQVTQLISTHTITFTTPTTETFTIGDFDNRRKTYFSMDVGGVVELYPSRRIMTRFDIGDTVIHYGDRQIPGATLSHNIIRIAPETRHNLQVSAGIGWRF